MSYVIQCAGLAGQLLGRGVVQRGTFLQSYDPEAHDGRGTSAWTTDPAAAMTFPDQAAAWDCWMQVPRCRPDRDDGRPNRPLTAFHITVMPLTAAQTYVRVT